MTGPRKKPERDPATALRLDYRAAFLRYLPRHDEAALATGYEIGRRALTGESGLLHIVATHHDVLREVLTTTDVDRHAAVIDAAADFLSEVLGSTYMLQRALDE